MTELVPQSISPFISELDHADSTVFVNNRRTDDDDDEEAAGEGQFAIKLFEFGNMNYFLYSLFCPCAAMAESRQKLDNSSYHYNLACLPLAPYRWLVRSAYNIGDLDSAVEDIFLSLCCPCFVINQIYQTTLLKQNPSSDGGKVYNTNHFMSNNEHDCDDCLKACLLQPCVIGRTMNHVVGMPFYLGCCCMNIFTARNIMRYQYRIKPTYEGDEYDEFLIPIGSCFAGMLLCNPILAMSLYLAMSTQVMKEIECRPKTQNKSYLKGFTVVLQDAVLVDTSLHGDGGAVTTVETTIVNIGEMDENECRYNIRPSEVHLSTSTNDPSSTSSLTTPGGVTVVTTRQGVKYIIPENEVHVVRESGSTL